MSSLPEGLVRLAVFESTLVAEVATEASVDMGRGRIECCHRINDRRLHLVGNFDQIKRIFRLIAAFSQYYSDRLPGIAYLILRKRPAVDRDFHTNHQRVCDFGEICSGDNRYNTVERTGGGCVEGGYPSVGVG